MAAQEDVDALIAQISKNVDVEKSAKVLIDGFATRQQAGIDAAMANGATPTQLKTLIDDNAVLKASADDLASSVAANTVAAPPTP